MRSPNSLHRAVTHACGAAPRTGPPLTAARTRQPVSPHTAWTGQEEVRRRLLVAAWLMAAVAGVAALAGFPGPHQFLVVALVLVLVATAIRHPRAADRTLAALVAVLLLPVLVIIGLAVWLTSHGPVLVRGERVDGSDRSLRFRTWADARPTPIGRVLEQSCLDELPALLDMVRGRRGFVRVWHG